GGDGDAVETGEDERAGGRGGGPVFVVQPQRGQPGGGGVAELAFQQGVHEQGGVQAEREGIDPGGGVRLGGGAVQHGFPGVVAGLDAGLAFVGGQDLGAGEAGVVGDQREAAVAGGVACGQRGIGDRGQGPGGAGDLGPAVAGAGPAAAGAFAGG